MTAAVKADYLILGNSAAAIAAVEKIRAVDGDGSIVMCSPEPYAAYGRPLISYLLEGKTDEAHLALKPADFYTRNKVDCRFGAGCEAVELDAAAHRAVLGNGTRIEYAKVLAATGSVPFVPPIPGLREAENVYPFITLDQAKACQAAAQAATEAAHAAGRQSRICVIGAGLIGLKAAEALLPHADDIVVLEMAPRILPAVLDDAGAAVLQRSLARRGIVCMPGITATELVVEEGQTHRAHLTDGTDMDFDFVVAAVGVRPNTALLSEAGATIGRGAVCDECMRTDLPDVYAAGDVTETIDALDGSHKCLALWPNAVAQGKVAGSQMAGASNASTYPGGFAVNAVDFFDISLLTGGIINPPEDGGYDVQVLCDGERYAKFVTKEDRLFGYILLNRPDNAGIYTAVIDQKVALSTLSDDFFEDVPLNIDFEDSAVRWARIHKFYPSDLDDRGWKERA